MGKGFRISMRGIAFPPRAVCVALAFAFALACACLLSGCVGGLAAKFGTFGEVASAPFELAQVASYSGEPSAVVNDDVPYFDQADFERTTFEEYSRLDSLGRCGTAYALVGKETMPTEPRDGISEVRPAGFRFDKYDWIDGKYLYNRCHLIGFQLAGENANPRNLTCGTRYFNVEGMEPYENEVASYVRQTGNHVLYRVMPVYEGDELVPRGVLMEAASVEDNGAGVRFCRWCYNVQPGVVIDYATGESHADESARQVADGADGGDEAAEPSGGGQSPEAEPVAGESATEESAEHTYILNPRTMRIHLPDCPSVADMSEKNKRVFEGTVAEAEEMGYKPCGVCNPQ